MKDCPFDPNYEFLFSGEELLLSACLFTNGWDIYNPSSSFIYHYYSSDKKKKIKIFYNDEKKKISIRRLNYFFKWNTTIPNGDISLFEIEKYPLGNVRSIESYWDYSGIKTDTYCDGRWCPFFSLTNISVLHKKNVEKYPENLDRLPLLK